MTLLADKVLIKPILCQEGKGSGCPRSRFSKPCVNWISFGVDITHQRYLPCLFVLVHLINANGVNPDRKMAKLLSQMLQSEVTVLGKWYIDIAALNKVLKYLRIVTQNIGESSEG
jgi:hypothetical protein